MGAGNSVAQPSSDNHSSSVSGYRKPLRPIAWWWVVVGLAAVGIAIWGTTWWMLTQTRGLHGTDLATGRMDAIKTGLSVGAGTGGAVALLLAMRRQWLSERDQVHREEVARLTQTHSERVASATEHDASERRVTDLYVKAADQLGSDKAPVRLAGLYALERLAQDNPTQRQTIVDVFCAYLRMPFTPPDDAAPADDPDQLTRRQEHQVRSAAEKILTSHLRDHGSEDSSSMPDRPDDHYFWPGIRVDLTGATLGGDYGSCRFAFALFNNALFRDSAKFNHAVFETDGFFMGARFTERPAHFYHARFGNRAVFDGANFGPVSANFRHTRFHGMTFFRGATLDGGIDFDRARVLIDFNTGWGDKRDWPDGWAAQDHDHDSNEPGWGLVVPAIQTAKGPKKPKP